MTFLNYDLFKVSKMNFLNYDLFKVSKMTIFNYDLFKGSKMIILFVNCSKSVIEVKNRARDFLKA